MSEMFEKVQSGAGFVAALDQSGGSTPKALKLYGIDESAYEGDDEMFETIHAMRSRIVTSDSFGGDRVVGAILFEDTMNREIDGVPSPRYLWERKGVVPFLKVDKGLEDEAGGAQILKPMPQLDDLCQRAVSAGVFGTKMRSVIKQANPDAVQRVVGQQFEVGKQILAHGLMPIIEPEVDIHCPDKAAAEDLLLAAIQTELDGLTGDQRVMLKLTLPDIDNLYRPLVEHDRVVRVVALSGGYSRDESNARLSRNHGVIASFSRALTEGLSAQMTDDEFDAALDTTIGSISEASAT